MNYTKKDYIETYTNLSFARHYFLTFEEYGLKGILPGFHHLRLGGEALPVGMYMEMGEEDWLVPVLSCHPMTAKKVGVDRFLCELLGRKGGLNGGMSGEAHTYDPINRVGPWSGFVGTSQGFAVGIALAMKMDKSEGCVVCGIGDGNLNEGVVSESLNLSAIWKLPIVWVIDNNGIAVSTSAKYANAINDLSERGKGFGLPGSSYDGADVNLVREVMHEAIAKARRCEPSLVEFRTSRWLGHFVGDPDLSRDPNKVAEERMNKDPLKWNRNFLIGLGIAKEKELDAIDKEQNEYIRDRIKFALDQPGKTAEDVFSPVFAD